MSAVSWCRANAMLLIALLAAGITVAFVPPDKGYLGYYDARTLACLFCVLAVVCALRNMDLFSALSQQLVQLFHTTRSVVTALVLITLVGSMLLTNDTALLTFLPLSWFVLHATGQDRHLAFTFILQNCAANFGGMLTPFGNPQNLYLFSYYHIASTEFIGIMLPPFLLSIALILLCRFFVPKDPLAVPEEPIRLDQKRAVVYALLFCLAVAMVLRVVPYGVGLVIIPAVLLVLDRNALKSVDWGLLLTFAAFFTFSGNLARIDAVQMFFARLLSHGTMLVSALTSQFISNVPAAILLSRFTQVCSSASTWAAPGHSSLPWPASSPFESLPSTSLRRPGASCCCFWRSALGFWRFCWGQCPCLGKPEDPLSPKAIVFSFSRQTSQNMLF